MVTAIIAAVLATGWLTGAARELVRFVGEDMAHYWDIGDSYTADDLNAVLPAAFGHGLSWPVRVPARAIRHLIHARAYAFASKVWEAAQPEAPAPPYIAVARMPNENTDTFERLPDTDPDFGDQTQYLPKH